MNQSPLRNFVVPGFVILGLILVALSALGLALLSQQPNVSLIPMFYRTTAWLFAALLASASVVIVLIARYIRLSRK